VRSFDLADLLLLLAFTLQSGSLNLRQQQAFFGCLLLQRGKPQPEGLQAVTQPDCPNTGRAHVNHYFCATA
jgi:hypothetical protein